MKLLILFWLALVKADLLDDAGCHSNFYFNDHDVGSASGPAQVTVLGPDSRSLSFISNAVQQNPFPPDNPCGGSIPHLFVHSCPHEMSSASQCTVVDTCPLVTVFPPDNNRAFEYVVHSAVASSNYVFVVTTGSGQNQIRIYRCDIAITGCIITDISTDIAPINIENPFIRATLTPNSESATQLHITYDTWKDYDYSKKDPYLAWVTCNTDLTNFRFYNVSDMSGALATTTKLDPYPVVVRDFLHIATVESEAGVSFMVIYSCNWRNIACVRRIVHNDATIFITLLQGHGLAYWPLNDYLYLTYVPNGGYFGYAGINRCSLVSNGDLSGDPICSNSQFSDLNREVLPLLTPAIAFADYLGAIIVVYQNIKKSGLLFIQYNADLSGDPKSYIYNSPKSDTYGYDTISYPSIFDIDSSTVLMRSVYVYTDVSDSSYHLHVGDVDVFPSAYKAPDVTFSPGYSPYYVHGTCTGTNVDSVITCPARIISGVCTQAFIFSGGDLSKTYIEHQPCFPKSGYGLDYVYQQPGNPHSQYACVHIDDQGLTYFDDGPSIPLAVDLLLDDVFGIDPLLLLTATTTRLVFWTGGIYHDWCYHNTVNYPGWNRDKCDDLARDTWLSACKTVNVGLIFDIISSIIVGQFPGSSIISCASLAGLYYGFLRGFGETAYLASNSAVHAPSFMSIDNFNYFGNTPIDPSTIHNMAILINSTTYSLPNGTIVANFTKFNSLLIADPKNTIPLGPPLIQTNFPPTPAPSISTNDSQCPCGYLLERIRDLEYILADVTRYTGTNTDRTTADVIDFGNNEFVNVRSVLVSTTLLLDQIYSNAITDMLTMGIATQQWTIGAEGINIIFRNRGSNSRYVLSPGLHVDITRST